MVLIKTQASLDLNPGSVAMSGISKSYPHRSPLLIQNIPVTRLPFLSSTVCTTTKTFSSGGLPSSPSAYPSHHTLHILEELSLPCEYGLSPWCRPQSRNPVGSSSPSEKVFANTPAPQDLGYGADISESRQYDTPCGRRCDLNILFPLRHLIISTPPHSPTGKPVELCPPGLLEITLRIPQFIFSFI